MEWLLAALETERIRDSRHAVRRAMAIVERRVLP
jgi:hypothetical protein